MSIGERKQQPTYGFRATRFRMESSLSSSSLSMLFSSLRGLMGETRFSSSSFFSELEKGSSILRTAGISNNRRSSWIEWSGALFFTLCVFHLLFVFYSIPLQSESSWLHLSHSPYKPKSCPIVPKCALSLIYNPNKARLSWWWTESYYSVMHSILLWLEHRFIDSIVMERKPKYSETTSGYAHFIHTTWKKQKCKVVQQNCFWIERTRWDGVFQIKVTEMNRGIDPGVRLFLSFPLVLT